MNIEIAIEIDSLSNKKFILIQAVSNYINEFFKTRSYGDDLQNILIGFICVKPSPESDFFFKKRKARFNTKKAIKLPDGSEYIFINVYSYDIKLSTVSSYESFIESSDTKSLKILVTLLIESLSNFKSLPKSVKDFDSELFTFDLLALLNELSLKKLEFNI